VGELHEGFAVEVDWAVKEKSIGVVYFLFKLGQEMGVELKDEERCIGVFLKVASNGTSAGPDFDDGGKGGELGGHGFSQEGGRGGYRSNGAWVFEKVHKHRGIVL